ncbi:MAG: helix-hairpin-helix domain-containing protein [Pseudobdellovibrio sp.]
MKKPARKAIFKAKQKAVLPVQDTRKLSDLVSVGPATLEDFKILGIHSVRDLKKHDAITLYNELCMLTGLRQDPCVEDVFQAAIEQAKNPKLVGQKKNWSYWSAIRKKRDEK